MTCVSMVSICISVFYFLQVTVTVNLVPLQPYDPKYISVKTPNACFFSIINIKKNSSQSSAAPKNWPSRKPQTLYMTLTIKIQSKLVAKVSQKFNSNDEWELTSLLIIRACFITAEQKPIFFLRLSISLLMVMAVFFFSKTVRLHYW